MLRSFHWLTDGSTYLVIHCEFKAFTCESQSRFPRPPIFLGPIAVFFPTKRRNRVFSSFSLHAFSEGSLDHHSMSASECTMFTMGLGIGTEKNQYRSLPKNMA